MYKFDQKRTKFYQINSKRFQFSIPLAIVKPKNLSKDSCVLIFNSGLSSTINDALWMNNPFYDNHYFVCYDRMGHGSNKNKPSQHKKKYLIELDELINWVKEKYPAKKIFLLGESWGSAINLIYYKYLNNHIKNIDKINGVVVWNMPTIISNPEKMPLKIWFKVVFLEILAYLLKIPSILPAVQSDYAKLSSNEVLVRAKKLSQKQKQHTFSTIACWHYINSSKRMMLKYANKSNLKFLYIQSGQDALCNKKIIKKFKQKINSKHFVFIPTGYHILSMEIKEATILYKIINNFIMNH